MSIAFLKKMQKMLKSFDFFIIFLFLVVFFLSFSMIINKNENLILEISSNGQNYEYDLSKNRNFSVEGFLGKSDFVIKDKSVFIENSPCKNKICEHTGKISKNGEWISCAPNKVFAIIKSRGSANNLKNDSNESDELDALAF